MVQLRTLKSKHSEFAVIIGIIEKFLIDFDKLAAMRRVIGVK
jgi:hypothetical protein